MLTVAETMSLDDAKANDRLIVLTGGRPAAEDDWRAVLAGVEPETVEEFEDDSDVETATIVDFASWVANMSAGEGGV